MRQVFFAILLFCTIPCLAQKAQELQNSYNYKRGLELFSADTPDYSEAEDSFLKEIEEHPKNGYAYYYLAVIYDKYDKEGPALEKINKAIPLLRKDKEWISYAYRLRASIHLQLGHDDLALDNWKASLKANPDDRATLNDRAEYYYGKSQYDLAEADYDRMIKANPGDGLGYKGKGRNANERREYQKAVDLFSYAITLDPADDTGYSNRAESYLGLGKYGEAADDVIKAIDLNGNQYAYTLLSKFKSVGRDILIAKLRIQQAKDKNNNLWSYLQGCVYEDGGDYNAAIKAFEAAYELGAEDEIKDRLAACHRNLGDYNKALDCIQQAILMDSTDMGHLLEQARSLYELGRTEEALEAIGKYIDKAPDNAIGYYFKAGFEEAQGKAEEAITDLTTAIVLAPDFAQIYLVRGNIYKRQGKTSEAMADYRKVVEIDTVFTDDDCAKYAYYELGDKAKAMAIQDSTLANSQSKNEYYDAACLYSRMGEYDKAMEYLQTALEKGFCEFTHIKDDHDLDPLRGRDDFKTLIGKYKRNVESSTTEKFTPPVIEADALVMPGREGGQAEEAGKGQLVSEIPFTRVQGGLCKVKCNINGLPLSFWLDTGASDVSMSIVEATFMMKNGYLSKDDVVGSSYYLDANGDVSEGTKLILRKVTFGDDVLTNVHASVIRNQKAPLLLGQSVLARLGKVEIDNQKCVIKISR